MVEVAINTVCVELGGGSCTMYGEEDCLCYEIIFRHEDLGW